MFKYKYRLYDIGQPISPENFPWDTNVQPNAVANQATPDDS
jgi:hypothetical protein